MGQTHFLRAAGLLHVFQLFTEKTLPLCPSTLPKLPPSQVPSAGSLPVPSTSAGLPSSPKMTDFSAL